MPSTYPSHRRPLNPFQNKIPLTGLYGAVIQDRRTNANQRHERTVLGSNLLEAVKHDNSNTVLPSWLSSAPLEMGSKGQGTLTADQWRTAMTIHLPITLIMEWGSSDRKSRTFKMLHHFLLLATILSLVSRRSTTFERRKTIADLAIEYLEKTVEFFPNATIQTNHHLMLHLPYFLKNFGPPHSWWAFVFERFIGILKRIKTNGRLGGFISLSDISNAHSLPLFSRLGKDYHVQFQ